MTPTRLVVFAKTVGAPTVEGNALNLKTWARLCELLGTTSQSVMVSPDHNLHVLEDGAVTIVLVPVTRFVSGLSYAWRALRYVRDEEGTPPSLAVASDAAMGGIAAYGFSWSARIPLQVHLQGDLFNVPRGVFPWYKRAGLRWLARFLCRRADQVRCVAWALRDSAICAGVPAEKLVVVRNRVDLDAFDREGLVGERRTFRDKLGWSSGDVVVLFSGSLNRFKGLDTLLTAFVEARGRCPGLRLLLVGDGPLREEVQRNTRAAGIESSVHITGWLAHGLVAPAMACGDIAVVPSASEGLPRVVLESSALQMPVIASAVGGIPEAIDDGATGFLVAPGDASGIAARIVELADDSELRGRMGRTGRAKMADEFEFETAVRRLADVTRLLLPADREN